ncbi:MAG TPA: hypothetical protein VHR45_11065 [Thermoanaerobaculia bacterium]|nr:hypothetical protein [Thermoanaerobaculia bacterium]
MAAPRHIVDALESVLSIYFSNCRHKERVAFILCDELVEVTCRDKIKQTVTNLGKVSFHDLLAHTSIGFNVTVGGLGKSIYDCHKTRNDMQHNNPAATVDSQYCADAIIDAVQVIEHCFPGATPALPEKLKVTLRVTRLSSRHGDPAQQAAFANAMQGFPWRGFRDRARQEETIVAPGRRANWGLVIPSEYGRIEEILNSVGVPPF